MTVSLPDGLPVVKMRIGHSDAWRELCDRNLEPVPQDITVNALIDTGASITVLDASLVGRLGLRDRGVCRVRGLMAACMPIPLRGNTSTMTFRFPFPMEKLKSACEWAICRSSEHH